MCNYERRNICIRVSMTNQRFFKRGKLSSSQQDQIIKSQKITCGLSRLPFLCLRADEAMLELSVYYSGFYV